ncbi:MAG: ABC transporter ATP-binding protein [Candidatus Paceibacterota bacterium]
MVKTLILNDVKKTFDVGKPFEVLKNITLDVNEGDFVSIVGPSGCGKSVLLYLIAGFIEKTSGQVLINNNSIVRPGTDRMMVFQDYVLLPWKSVYDNVLFSLEKSDLSDKEKKELTTKYIDLVGLTQFKNWHIHRLSGGMKQKVAIARALIVNSKILLMDEPFSALDPQQRKYLRKSLLEICEKTKKTVLFVTHSVSEALYLSNKIYVMSSCPAVIKNRYDINIPHPRHSSDPQYVRFKEKIEEDLFQEFEKTLLNQREETLIDLILKTEVI